MNNKSKILLGSSITAATAGFIGIWTDANSDFSIAVLILAIMLLFMIPITEAKHLRGIGK